jgi:hypothetical protein
MVDGTINNVVRRAGFLQKTGRFHLRAFNGFLALAFCLLISLAARASNFTAALDHDSIQMGETATLTLTFEGGGRGTVPTPDVPGLQFVKTDDVSGFSFSSVNGNGHYSSTVTVTYSITPERAGQFTIPAMSAEIDGQRFTTPPLKLTVTQPGSPSSAQINSGSEVAFMRFVVPEKAVYPGQFITAQAQIFLRDDVQEPHGFGFTAMPADGFTVGKEIIGGGQHAQVGDRTYTVFPISVALTALKPGTLTIGPVTAAISIVTGGQSFGPFGGLFGGEERRVSLAADSVTVQCLPLPSQNVPPSFNGAIGDYNMVFSAGPTNLAVGDPVTVRVQISGRGTLDGLMLPDQAGWNGFKMFTPTSKFEAGDDLGDQGTKTFEEIVTPQNANIHELPPFSFSYFNPDDGRYHTLTQPAMALTVTPVAATPLPAIASAKQPANENQTPQDIVPIRENLGTLAQVSAPLITHPAFLALQTIPVIAFISALVWRRRTDNLANNPRLLRQRAVAQLITGGLDDLNKFASENKSNEFFASLFRLLQELLGERLDCPAFSITEADVDNRLVLLGARPEALESLREMFHACNQARYAPVQTSQELSALAKKFKDVAGELQNLKT